MRQRNAVRKTRRQVQSHSSFIRYDELLVVAIFIVNVIVVVFILIVVVTVFIWNVIVADVAVVVVWA